MPTEADLKSLPEDERLMQAAQAAKAAASAQSMAESLKEKAALVFDPKKRDQMLSEAYNREMEAHGNSKKARILKSGTFQGAVGGAGIGAATGVGLGTIVGTLVGTVASIPTTAVGGLVGGGVGAIHGPWLKFGGGKKGEKEKIVEVPQEAIDSGTVDFNKATGEVTAQHPEDLEKIAAAAEQKKQAQPLSEGKPRKQPRKIEVRSNKSTITEPHQSSSNLGERKKPKKLEIRSNKTKPSA